MKKICNCLAGIVPRALACGLGGRYLATTNVRSQAKARTTFLGKPPKLLQKF